MRSSNIDDYDEFFFILPGHGGEDEVLECGGAESFVLHSKQIEQNNER
jgi:hypothetical protein